MFRTLLVFPNNKMFKIARMLANFFLLNIIKN